MKRKYYKVILTVFLILLIQGLASKEIHAELFNPNTDWFMRSKYGLFVHFLGETHLTSTDWSQLVSDFDVSTVVNQLEQVEAGYFFITLGQNSGYYCAPNSTYDLYTGCTAGEKCSTRDLPSDIYEALKIKNIKLMLYLPSGPPKYDKKACTALGWNLSAQRKAKLSKNRIQGLPTTVFKKRWSEVIQEWADRYGDKIAGWWFDGARPELYDESYLEAFARAAKHGNPNCIVAFNMGAGLKPFSHYTDFEDYTGGHGERHLNDVPASRWVNGSQWHALTYIGTNWGKANCRFSDKERIKYIKTCNEKGGVVTLDVGPNKDRSKGPIGMISEQQMNQLLTIKNAIRIDNSN